MVCWNGAVGSTAINLVTEQALDYFCDFSSLDEIILGVQVCVYF